METVTLKINKNKYDFYTNQINETIEQLRLPEKLTPEEYNDLRHKLSFCYQNFYKECMKNN